MIKTIETTVHFVIFSFNTTSESNGTKTYPSDSRIGMSLRLTPLLMAAMLINNEPKKITYAVSTRQLSNERMNDLCFLSALFFKSSCEQADKKMPVTTNMYQKTIPSMLILQVLTL